MPMPWSYRHATKDWRAFLADAQERLGTPTDNTTYTAVQGVLVTFRRRLTPAEVARFAQALPAVLRAILIDGWNPDIPPLPFAPRDVLAAEVKALRPHHNLTPDHAIEAVARALRRHLDQGDFDRILATLPQGAVEFWSVPGARAKDLERRIV